MGHFYKVVHRNQVDFRSPPVESVAEFLLYLFEDKKLQPSTIDGYRSAIADKLGSTTANISKDDILLRKIHLPFPDHCYMLVPSNSLANVEKRFKKP